MTNGSKTTSRSGQDKDNFPERRVIIRKSEAYIEAYMNLRIVLDLGVTSYEMGIVPSFQNLNNILMDVYIYIYIYI
jgi:hypothetical protein